MASTAKTKPVKLSPREARLFAVMKRHKSWVPSMKLKVAEFGPMDDLWPVHARTMITGTMSGIEQKLRRMNAGKMLEKRGGGRAGVEYRLV